MNKLIISSLVSVGVLFSSVSSKVIAQIPHDQMQGSRTEQPSQFRQIDQPLWLKSTVILGGVGLIGLELWWFLLSKSKSQTADTHQGVQEATITVDGGYEPNRVVVKAGQLVRLNFDRRDPSSCLEAVRLPEFRIAKDLPLNQVTPIEFTPTQPGEYEFVCGMNMFRGVIEVQGNDSLETQNEAQVLQSR
ncbi:cupredoxin domain-containing protein [Phormidesmis priestleyi]|uniref:cupredoxin domain-containing protein n=1 Tax=Phormidesmis priestleyi TaxID=268141 RepID=UPI00083AB562|nr:cupredoxin domain-containing protein [Phormidesmis priestleyi]